MKRRVVILTEIIAPYRIPVFNALAARCDVDPHVIFLSETDLALRQWHVYKDEIKFSCQVLPSLRRNVGKRKLLLNWGLSSALRRADPEAVIVGGYNYPASWRAALWARRHSVPLVLWSESNAQDKPRHAITEFLKKSYGRFCQAFVAAGKSSRAYLGLIGADGKSILVAPDAVDIGFYSRQADSARQRTDDIRARDALPKRYFLNVGRLVKEKGVFDLLAAYAKLDDTTRRQIGLVFVGDGPARVELAKRAAQVNPAQIVFCGWKHRDELAEIYALAETFVFPTHSDPWGLVVNEAMACGLPIIASDVAGCVPDLVEHGSNGFVIRAGDVQGFAGAMQAFISQPDLAARLGRVSREKINAYSPAACANGLASAVTYVCGIR